MANITYSNKSAGNQFSAAEVNQIKSVVNTNYSELQGVDSRLNSAESSITSLEGVTIPDINSSLSTLTNNLDTVTSNVDGLLLSRADWDTAALTVNDNQNKWMETYTVTSRSSADWDETYSSVSTSSANWDLAYSTVISLSTDWAIDIDTQLDITTTDLYATVTSNSASWADSSTSVTQTYVDENYVDGVKWTPLDDTSSIVAWHDASDTTTLTTDVDNNLTGWVDKITGTNAMWIEENEFATDGGGTVLSNTTTVNGLNVVYINENAFLRYSSNPYITIGNTASIFIVFRVDTVNDQSDAVLSFKTPGGSSSWQLGSGNQNKFSGLFSAANMGSSGNSVMADDLTGVLSLVQLKFDWANQTVTGYLNGAQAFTDTYTQFNSIGNDLLYLFINRGEQKGITGAACELITTNDISYTNTTKIESYLCSKWGVQIASGHPYESTPRVTNSEVTFTEQIFWPQGGSADTNTVNTVVKANSGSWGSAGGFTNWSEDSNGHIIPASNATYDIGSAEKKVRHFYLSDTTMYFGEAEVAFNSGNILRSVELTESVEVPAPTSPGRKGDMRYIAPYMYVCIEADTWVRQTVETGW